MKEYKVEKYLYGWAIEATNGDDEYLEMLVNDAAEMRQIAEALIKKADEIEKERSEVKE